MPGTVNLAELAESAGVSVGELTSWLEPAHDLTLDEIDTILMALDCDVRYEVVPQ